MLAQVTAKTLWMIFETQCRLGT